MTHIDVDIIKYHQGSLTATVHGSTVERLSYDLWGRRRNPFDFGYADVRHTSDSDYHDIYSFVERAYEPRDLGLLQLPTDDPIVVLMEKEKTPKEAEKENRNKTKKIKTAF